MILKEYALIFDDNGRHILTKKINKNADTFRIDKLKRSFNVIRKDYDYIRFDSYFFFLKKSKIYYVYNKNDSEPKSFIGKENKTFDSRIYDTMLETKVLIDLNKIKSGLFGNLDTRTILFILGGIALIVYFITGGKLW